MRASQTGTCRGGFAPSALASTGSHSRTGARSFTLRDGRRAVDYLLETQLTSVPANRKRVLGFPEEIEFHPNMFLKTMLEAGVPLDHPFTHQGRRHTLQDVVDGARALLRPGQSRAGRSRS